MKKRVESFTRVKNKLGLHIRPATYIAKLLEKSRSKVILTYKGESANARSVMGIMILAAPKNAKLKIEIEGADADETMRNLLHAFDSRFEEDS